MVADASRLRAIVSDLGGSTLIDLGLQTQGSIDAGIQLARLCLGDAATISLHPSACSQLVDLDVMVHTDHPVAACLGGQYAGWPIQVDDYFAMGSGPMRMRRGKEETLQHLDLIQSAEPDDFAVGVLESDSLPSQRVAEQIATECGVTPSQLKLAIAPSTSVAGTVQVVARCIETALHKMHALNFDVNSVISASGIAPLPPPAKPGDTIAGIGRTNDAILYGGRVSLWVDADDATLETIISRVPSQTSADHGRPFSEVFKDYDYDFYKVDPMLFSPAVVTLHSLQSGRSWRAGSVMEDVLKRSFGR
ncbi:MAG: methenyltetrahydromethanopterin cyclohydrolase [Planctomycetota bacterium]